jgi:hypothetical protein
MTNLADGGLLSDAADLVERYRDSVRGDLEAIPEPGFWSRPVPNMVSPANLALHLTGNLRHFVGHLLAGTDYERDREREFEAEPWAGKGRVLTMWDEACVETRTALLALDPRTLDDPAPLDTFPGGVPVHAYLIRLLGHLTYHAGQIRALRRLLAAED